MRPRSAVYLIDDDPAVREAISAVLRSYGIATHAYATTAAFLREGPAHGAGCLVADADDPDFADRDLLAGLQERGISLPTVLTFNRPVGHGVAGWPQPGLAWLNKPFAPDDLLRSIGQATGGGLA